MNSPEQTPSPRRRNETPPPCSATNITSKDDGALKSASLPARNEAPSKASALHVAPPPQSRVERLLDPLSWQGRRGPIAFVAHTFFTLFPKERAAWIVASGGSFLARIGAAEGMALVSHSRTALPTVTFAAGLLVNWPIAYRVLRWQDRRECVKEDGSFDGEAYRERAKQRMLFLPKQELGYACCFGISSALVMGLSYKLPFLFSGWGGAAISIGGFAMQWFLVNHYDNLYASIGKTLKRCAKAAGIWK